MLARNYFQTKLEPLYLMDASAFIYKGYYAYKNMSRSDGFPTSSIYIVARILLKLLKDEQAKYFSFVLDGKGKNFRHDIFPAYKANRKSTPEDLQAQIEPITRLVRSLGLHLHISENCEADDCLASLCKRYKQERPVVLVAIDKDLNQCLDENVVLFDPTGKDSKLVTKNSFEEKTGLKVESWADIQALIGDTSDNIPGVRGIGEKTAVQIFQSYSNLEEIRDNFDKLDPKLQTKLQDGLEAMFLYRELTRLKSDLCTDLSLNDLEVQALPVSNNLEDAITIFREYEMPSLEKELLSLIKSSKLNTMRRDKVFAVYNTPISSSAATNSLGKQASLFDLVNPSQASAIKVSENQSSEQVSEQLSEQIIFFDNFAKLSSCKDKVLALVQKKACVHLAYNGLEYCYTGANYHDLFNFVQVAQKIIVDNYKPLIHIEPLFSQVQSKIFDLSIAAYLISPEERDYSFTKLAAYFSSKSGFEHSLSANLALALAKDLEDQLNDLNLVKLYYELEIPLVAVLAQMENNGISVDLERLNAFLLEVQLDLDNLSENIYKAAGRKFNIRSAQQLGEVLFNTLELSSKTKTKGGQISTSQEVLEKLQASHPVVDALLEFRKLEKLRSTYLEPLPKLVDNHGRIHTSFNQCATATGRLSSSNPNLQNIPIRGEMGKRMRSCFIAPEGKLLISADYSQIELRVLAHLSNDQTLISAFNNNEDIHTHTASLLFDLADDQISSDQRRVAKTINFGLIYGMGANKLATDLKISHKEAKSFIDKYFEKLSGVKDFFEQVLEEARINGYVTTITDRRRPLATINALSKRDKALAERQAINTCVQGSAADIIKLAMLAVHRSEDLQSSSLLLQIHDELILESSEANAQKHAEILCSLMTKVLELKVPLTVDYSIDKSW